MKKQLILGSLIALSGVSNAQWLTSGPNVYSDNVNYPGNYGIGTSSSPAFKLDINVSGGAGFYDGLRIFNSGTPAPSIQLDNAGGKNWSIQSKSGPSTSTLFYIRNETDNLDVICADPNGHVAMGSPSIGNSKLYVLTQAPGDQTGIFGVHFSSGVPGIGVRGDALNPGAISSTGIRGNAGLAQINIGGSFQGGAQIGGSGTNNTGASALGIGASVVNTGGLFTGGGGTAGAAAPINIGVSGMGLGNGGAGMVSKGVYGTASGSPSNYGGYFDLRSAQPCNSAITNIALYATVLTPCTNDLAAFLDGNVKIKGTIAPSGSSNPAFPIPAPYALWVQGNALTTAGTWYASDKRFKDNIRPLRSSLEKLEKLTGYNYTFRTEEFKDRNFNSGNQIGLIAQELKEVFPELVNEGPDGYLAVNYQGMVPVMLEAIKEQQSQIEAEKTINKNQQQQIDELKAMVNSLAGNAPKAGTATGVAVNLSDKNVVVLDQNVPNPFAESTVISYNIPTEFGKAQIIFTTVEGTVIKTVEITQKGPGTLNVFANDLSHGVYSYVLVVDGKNIATKKMIRQ